MWKWINAINVWWFYTKKFFKSPLAYVGIFFIPIMFIIGLGSILQTSAIFVETIGFSLLFIEAITFGSTYFLMKKSTLNYNSNLSDIKNYEINFAVFLLMSIVGSITLFYSVGIFILIEHYTDILVDIYAWDTTSPLARNGLNVTESIKIRWKDVDFWAILYYGSLYTLVMYSLSIFLTAFTRTQKTFFIMILGFITYTLIFGGIMSTMFGASNVENVPVVPSKETPGIFSPWKKPSLNLNQNSWTIYVSYLNPLFWVNEWGFFLFGNHAYYNIEFNNDIDVTQELIVNNLTKDFNVYFKLHEGTAFVDKFLCSNLNSMGVLSSDLPYEQNIYQLSYTYNNGEPIFALNLYDFTTSSSVEDPIWSKSIDASNKDLIVKIPADYVFSIKQNQGLSPNLKYFKWSESWQYNASLILPYIFILFFEFSTIILNRFKKIIKNN